MNIERQIAKQLGNLLTWNDAGGISTTGGKSCISYAIQIGLKRTDQDISTKGIYASKKKPVVITSKENHKSISYCCRMLGIGTDNCWLSDVNTDGTMDIQSCKELIKKALDNNYSIACIVLSGGNTVNLSIDCIQSIKDYINLVVKEYNLNYIPYIFFDTCVGWPWLFYKDYDFDHNDLSIEKSVIDIIQKAANKISYATIADGCSFDFHKTGNSPYQSSFFLTKNKQELYSLGNNNLSEPTEQGSNFVYSFTIEHSRQGSGIISIWDSIQAHGVSGYRSYVAHISFFGKYLRDNLANNKDLGMELINPYSLAPASLYFPTCAYLNNSSFNEVLQMNKDMIKKHNLYSFKLFHYFLNQSLNQIDRLILRYIPQYGIAKCGEHVAIIIIYPLSIYNNEEYINDIISKLYRIKKNFDINYKDIEDDVQDINLTYVPR